MPQDRDQELATLRRLVGEMNAQTSRNEREKQNMRIIRGKLDDQLDIFSQIHRFTARSFRARTQEELHELIPEGIVDIFQLEQGALLGMDVSGERLELIGGCNTGVPLGTAFAVEREWLAQTAIIHFDMQRVFVEAPDERSPIHAMGLAHAMYVPMYDNDRNLVGVILGGISKEAADVYDFEPEALQASFMVYCQQMNGIYNNFTAIAQAKSAGEAKMRFLANLSHEIRTPMNAISGMVQIANRSEDITEIKKCTAQIDVSLRHLLGLLGDVLDISKIEEGKLKLSSERFSLDRLVEGIVTNMGQAAQDKGVAFRVEAGGFAGISFRGDAMRLTQVLLNLLSNAIKFTDAGGQVTLRIEEKSMDSSKALLRFSVADTGIGMSQEAAERVFSAFEQADGSTSRRFGGTGLGLTISQRIVELMGSRIKVSSEAGKGSTFSFTAWLEIDEEPAAEAAVPAPAAQDKHYDFSGRNILVVDDVDINREIIYAFLEDTGAHWEGATNGLEAVEAVRKSPPGHFDLILMDVQMPHLDGCEATRQIRALDRSDAKDLVILAMTANVFKEDMQRVAEAGMNGHIGKPIEYGATMDLMARCMGRAGK